MPKDTFHFAAISKITLEHEHGTPTSILTATDVRLEVSGNIDKAVYIDNKGLPRKMAMKPLSNALLHGLIIHMRHCASKGWWEEGNHMQYVIENLQRAFVATGDLGESTMEY